MQGIPSAILRRAYQRQRRQLLRLPLYWGLVGAVGYFGYWAVHHARFGVALGIFSGVCIGVMVRGIGSIGHDAAHGTVSRNRIANYLLGFCAWSATLSSFTLYRAYHLDHHRIVNMPHDVDRVRLDGLTSNPRLAGAIRLTIYLGFYPLYWSIQVGRYARSLSPALKLRMAAEIILICAGVVALYVTMGAAAFWAVLGTQFAVGAFLASVTSMVEHFGIAYDPSPAYSARSYATSSRVLNVLWNGTPFHHEHHTYPGVPYYNLRRFHQEAVPYYSERARANVFPHLWRLVFALWVQAARAGLDDSVEYAHDAGQAIRRAA